ncbi:EutP/PduV family microcompartment system protein [Clostridium gasigenes]|uniref:EutP/PduV family microcompartment system protein n=1 Tax=Clostridium gasigenes TaxID=94869 RepID=UPI001625937A|nr:EutP/PduV family microcompartment system protein [Clostridium gasigenes]MBB6624349.1 EutP/PduV family microcompartment system protein [Clostridium gasigenes]
MKKVIFMGKCGCGKTTLCQKLHAESLEYKKTQAIDNYENAIDTPGEYIENRSYYRALIVTSVDADVIALIQDCTEEENYFPPAFASIFPKEVIGIITKIDLSSSEEEIIKAEEALINAGAQRIFKISTMESIGIKELEEYLK